MDSKDNKKEGITLLGDVGGECKNKYIYEIIVFTGNRLNAGTKSKVRLIWNKKNNIFDFTI